MIKPFLIKVGLAFICVLLFPLISTAAPPTKATPTPQASPYQSCLITSYGGRSFGGQSSFSFFNGCGERLYINACVKDSWGDNKIYKSNRAIMVGGRYTIYTFPDMDPRGLQWVAGPSDPGVPPLCAKK